ncbi:MAG TPA: TolC family outer membrane protein [Caulobacteraceae bacterium]|jgi:outer membrane protein|nr:TolC family outer membrane protein [Caulobacteraceae bacterium]
MSLRRRGLSSAAACALSVALAVTAGAAPAVAETLLDAVTLAYQTNPTLLAQRATQRATDEEYVQAMAGFRPTIGIIASDSQINGLDTTVGAASVNLNTSSASITAQQTLYSGGRIATAVDAAQADILEGREQLRTTEAQIMTQVVQAYVDVRRDMRALAINQENQKVLQGQLDQVQAQFDVGEVTRTDVAQAQARLAAAKAQVDAAGATLSVSRAAYASVVGQTPTDLQQEPELPGVPASFDDAMDIASKENPGVRSAQYAEQAAHHRVAQARADYLPNASLQASYGATLSPPLGLSLSQRSEFQATAQVNVPIFTGGLTGSRVRAAIEHDNAARVGIDGAQRTMLQQVSQAWAQVLSTRASLTSNQEQVKADEIAAEGTRQEYQVGLRTTIDVLNAEQELRDAQLALVNSEHDNYVATAQLLAAMGRLEARELIAGVKPYDPKANFDRVKNKGSVLYDRAIQAVDERVRLHGDHPVVDADAPIDTQLKAKVPPAPVPDQP